MVDRLNQIITEINTFMQPVAILALTVIAFMYVLSPAAQEWMMQNRGVMTRVFFGLIIFPAITTIVALFLG